MFEDNNCRGLNGANIPERKIPEFGDRPRERSLPRNRIHSPDGVRGRERPVSPEIFRVPFRRDEDINGGAGNRHPRSPDPRSRVRIEELIDASPALIKGNINNNGNANRRSPSPRSYLNLLDERKPSDYGQDPPSRLIFADDLERPDGFKDNHHRPGRYSPVLPASPVPAPLRELSNLNDRRVHFKQASELDIKRALEREQIALRANRVDAGQSYNRISAVEPTFQRGLTDLKPNRYQASEYRNTPNDRILEAEPIRRIYERGLTDIKANRPAEASEFYASSNRILDSEPVRRDVNRLESIIRQADKKTPYELINMDQNRVVTRPARNLINDDADVTSAYRKADVLPSSNLFIRKHPIPQTSNVPNYKTGINEELKANYDQKLKDLIQSMNREKELNNNNNSNNINNMNSNNTNRFHDFTRH